MAQTSESQAEKAETIKDSLDEELVSSAEAAGVDIDDIVDEKIQKHEGYAAKTVFNFVKSELERKIEAEMADNLKGILMGSRDRFSSNFPRQHSLVRSSGDHIQVSTWDGVLPTPSGDEVTIPTGGAIVDMRCEYDEQYESYEGKQLDSVQQLDGDELVENLKEVAISPDDLSAADEYEVVVVQGTISYLDTQTLFEDGEPADEGPVMMKDKRGELQPHFELSLAQQGQTSLRGHVERQRYGRPYFRVTDLMNLVQDAYEMKDRPESQAEFVGSGLVGTDVIMVGNVNNYDTNRRDDGEVVNYVDLAVTAIVEADPDGDVQTELTEAAEDSIGGREAPEPEGDEDEEDGEDEEPEDSEDSADVDQVRADIEQYAELTGEGVSSLTVDDINEKAGGIEAPDSVIDHALRQLRDDGDGEEAEEDQEDGGGEESDDDSDDGDEYSEIIEAGQYQCPDDECPGKGSSLADLIGQHIVKEHEPSNATEAKDWLDERV